MYRSHNPVFDSRAAVYLIAIRLMFFRRSGYRPSDEDRDCAVEYEYESRVSADQERAQVVGTEKRRANRSS